jgi:PKD repeat protein
MNKPNSLFQPKSLLGFGLTGIIGAMCVYFSFFCFPTKNEDTITTKKQQNAVVLPYSKTNLVEPSPTEVLPQNILGYQNQNEFAQNNKFAQNEGVTEAQKQDWAKLIKEHPFNNRPKQSKKAWKKIAKNDRPDLIAEQDFLKTMDPALGTIPQGRKILANQKTIQKLRDKAPIAGVNWVERGPNNVGGRTIAMMFDPNDGTKKKVWSGGVGGGLWVTNDITATNYTWTHVSQIWDNIAISSMAFDPTTTQTFYVGTGEGNATGSENFVFGGTAQRGAGLWKSTNGGTNWARLASTTTTDFHYINEIAVTNTGAVLLACEGGLFRSNNGGTSWTNVNADAHSDVKFASTGVFLLAGTKNGRILKSTDDGITWTEVLNATGTSRRVELAIAGSNNNVVYSLAGKNGGGQQDVGFFKKSTDAGVTWSDLAIPLNYGYGAPDCNPVATEHFTRGQAFFGLIVEVNPTNPNVVVIGGIDVYRSTDGGTSFVPISNWVRGNSCSRPYVHADQHDIKFRPGASDEAIFGHDGGVSYSNNVGNSGATPAFLDKSNTYNVTQFFACAVRNEVNGNYFLAGAQDNGTQRFTQAGVGNTTEASGGDGAYCHIDQLNPNIQISAYTQNQIYRSLDGGTSFPQVFSIDNTGHFINPTEYDSQTKILYAADNGDILRRFNQMDQATPTTDVVNQSFGGSKISALKVSPYTNNTLFLGIENGKVFKVTNANATPTFTEIGTALGATGFITCIEVGANDNNLLVIMSNYGVNSIWETSDGGTTWNNKDNASLPDMPIRWALYNPANRNEVLLATETGMWSTNGFGTGTNSAPTWNPTSTNLANVRCDMIKFRPADKMVVIATHGRGLFTSDVFVTTSLADFTANQTISCTGSLTVNFTDTSLKPNGSWAWDVDNNGTTDYTTQNPSHTYSTAGIYAVKLTINAGGATITKQKYIIVMTAAPTASTCAINGGTNNINLNNNNDLGIKRFALNTIDNTTSHNDGMYNDYACSKFTTLDLNTLYNVTITTSSLNNEGAKLYIDYNDNGIFTDAGEEVVIFPSNNSGTRTLSFTTPMTGVTMNKGLRARIISRNGGIVPADACETGTRGQVEDYTVYFQAITATITSTGTPSAVNTTYGTASSSTNFNVAGTNITGGILVTPPSTNFEVSLDNTAFSNTITISGTGTIASTPIHIRLKATTPVGTYNGNIVFSSTGATNVNVMMPNSTVSAKNLTISGITANNKVYDNNNTAMLSGTGTLNGIVGADVVTITGTPSATFASINVSTGIIVTTTGYILGGANAGNYTVSQPIGLTADITAKNLTISGLTANNKTFDGNTTATLSGTATLNGIVGVDVVTITGTPTANFNDAIVGTGKAVTVTGYSLTGANAGNYTLSQPTGLTADITAAGSPNMVFVNTTTGNDANDGLSAITAKKTIGAGVLLVNEGGTVNIMMGAYNEGVVATKNMTFVTTGIVTVTGIIMNGTSKTLTLTNPLYTPGGISLVNGTIASDGNLVLMSNATATALIDDFSAGNSGNITGNIQVQRYVGNANVGYKYFGSPVTGAMTSLFGGNQTFSYNESIITTNMNNGWQAYSGMLNPFAGYNVHVTNAGTATYMFVGTANTGTYNRTITRQTPNGTTNGSAGFNAIGNPYPSPISWTALLGLNVGQTTGSAWFFKTTELYKGQWGTVNSSGVATNGANNVITSGQGFLVRKATAGSSTFTINNTARTQNLTQAYYRNNNIEKSLVRLQLSNNTFGDEVVAYIEENTNEKFDVGFDTEKVTGESDKPYLAFAHLDQDLSILAKGEFKNGDILPLIVRANGQFTLNLIEKTKFNHNLYLLDKKLNVKHDLSKPYTFNANVSDANRFVLVIGEEIENTQNILSEVKIWAKNQTLFVDFSEAKQANNAQMLLTDIQGKTILTTNNLQKNNQINVNVNKGVYLVKIQGENSTISKKVIFE